MAAPLYPFHSWTDALHLAGWRMQRNAQDAWRIQDELDRTVWSGPADEADAAWQQLVDAHQLTWAPGSFLITLHGLWHHRRMMKRMVQRLPESCGTNRIRFEYASCCHSIREHAAALDRVLAALPAGSRCDFVAHSMGNLVTRGWFGMRRDGQATADVVPSRMVMLAPPNQGSDLARRLSKLQLFHRLAGTAGQEVGLEWESIEPDLPAPDIPFGVIAARVPRWMINPLLGGESDWIVRVRETPLAGAKERITMSALHATMMRSPKVIAATERFLTTGTFS
ncbi:esterase/lipase family protein [Roseimaritima ulvae]|uniref:Alpha/beta hydrolase family protein n=1 Tax=Roseimaritima ulvae TaxID=980254 RepID=A0A5B9QPS9_9BACT|nr:alpha/beta hydrolase [Roseimaritima ulvae]QEG39680.1 Alpha/beta hydrolase family protein [Roseimaritima ulvae]